QGSFNLICGLSFFRTQCASLVRALDNTRGSSIGRKISDKRLGNDISPILIANHFYSQEYVSFVEVVHINIFRTLQQW
ncbi:hypothetical protein ACJX0J_013479, partial [Zea mays]